MALDSTRANEILTWMHGGAAVAVLTGGTRLRIYTATGTAGAAGTEVATGGGYTAGSAGGVALTWAAPAGQSQATSAVASVTNYPRPETVNGIEVYESGGTFRRIEFGGLTTPRAMAAGDTLSFAAGAITSALA